MSLHALYHALSTNGGPVRIFVSYARHDRIAVDALLQDIRRARHDVWVDEELTGGQSWWETILGTIRGADLFVVALSPDWLGSKACAAELHYAVACNRPVLSIMVGRVSPQMAPPVIANAQILDYVERTPDAAISLVTALAATRPPGPLPQPLPAEPPVPMSYMNTYRERVDQLSLTFQEQSQLLSELRAHLADDDDRECATELILRLRHRGDITESIGVEIDSLLASSPTSPLPPTVPPTVPPILRPPEPSSALHVATAVVVPPPPAAASVGSPASKWDTGTFITLLVVSAIPCIGLIGIIIGAINVKKPARRGQATVLLVVGIAVTALILANTHFSSGSGTRP